MYEVTSDFHVPKADRHLVSLICGDACVSSPLSEGSFSRFFVSVSPGFPLVLWSFWASFSGPFSFTLSLKAKIFKNQA